MRDRDSAPRLDIGRDVPFPMDDEYTPEDGDLDCVLIAATRDPYTGIDSAAQVGVYVYSLGDGEPRIDESVQFGVLAERSVDARLRSASVRTNEDGLAATRLSVGSTAGAVTVRAFIPCAASLDIEVQVVALPLGALRVRFEIPEADIPAVHPITVYGYDADGTGLRCRDIVPPEIPVEPSSFESEAREATDRVAFENLRTDSEYTVIAIGRGPRGERAAFGCNDGVFVREGVLTEVVISLEPVPP